MILGSIVDAGVPIESLIEALDKLNVSGYELSHQVSQRGGVNGTHVVVTMDDDGKRKRTWQNFVETTRASSLSSEVIERSCAVFQRLGEAEASVHGTTPDQIHLHELGEVDTLVDVVGSVAGLDLLGIDRLYSRWARRAFSGWEISAVTLIKNGTPFTVVSGSDAPGFGNVDGSTGDRPHIIDASILGTTIGQSRCSWPVWATRSVTDEKSRVLLVVSVVLIGLCVFCVVFIVHLSWTC